MNDRRISIATLVAVLLVGLIAAYGAFQRPAAISARAQSFGYTNFTQVDIAAPTYQVTDEPALIVDTAGLGSILEVRDAATPVFVIEDGGDITGSVLRYATAGTQIVCSSQTVTDTASAVHGLTTPLYAIASLGEAATGDAQSVTAAISGTTVTLNVYQSALTPTANSAGAVVEWCVIGTP